MNDNKNNIWSQAPFNPSAGFKEIGNPASKIAEIGGVIVRLTGDNYAYGGIDSNTDSRGAAYSIALEKSHTDLLKAGQLFEELSSKYSINHVGFAPFLAESNGLPTPGVVSSRVDGRVFGESTISELSGEPKVAAGKLANKLIDYLEDKSESGEPFLTDIFRIDQFTYDVQNDEFVLHDMDIYMSNNNLYIVNAIPHIREFAVVALPKDDYEIWNKRAKELEKLEVDYEYDMDEDF